MCRNEGEKVKSKQMGWVGTCDVGRAVGVRVDVRVKAIRKGWLELELSSQEPLFETAAATERRQHTHWTHAIGTIHAVSLAGLFTYYNCESVQPHTPPLRVQAENMKS